MAAAPDDPAQVHKRIMDLIRKVWIGEEVTPAELQDAVPFREFSFLSEDKQFSIFADVYNVVYFGGGSHTAPDAARESVVPGQGRDA